MTFLQTAELVLRDPKALVERIHEGGPGPRALPRHLCLLAVLGFGAFGALLGVTHSPLAALASGPKLALVGLGSLAICAPALFVYGRLLGNRGGLLEAICESLVALATSGLTLLAISPVFLVYSRWVEGPPHGYFHVMLGAVATLAFAGLRGVLVLMLALRRGLRPILHLPAWALLYGLVGLQAAWTLRPFVGTPEGRSGGLVLLRPLESSALDATFNLLASNVNAITGRTTVQHRTPFTAEGED